MPHRSLGRNLGRNLGRTGRDDPALLGAVRRIDEEHLREDEREGR